MILYLDTSALVPLLIHEPTSKSSGALWDAADNVVCARLAYVEAVAAVAQAVRLGRLTASASREARSALDDLWRSVDVIELDAELMAAAAAMAVVHGLRGYDATHCAAAIQVNDSEVVAVSGDARLLTAWRAEGVAVHHLRS